MKQSHCGSSVIGAETFLFAGHVIMDVIPSAFFPFIQSVSLSHNCVYSDEVTTIDLDSGMEQVGVTQGRPELNHAGISAGTRLWKLTKPHSSNWLGLEAEVGIEPSAVTRQFAKVIPEKRDPVHSDVSFDWKPFAISRLKVTCLSPGICVCSSPRGKTVLLLSDQERIGSSFGRSQVLGGIKIKAQWCK